MLVPVRRDVHGQRGCAEGSENDGGGFRQDECRVMRLHEVQIAHCGFLKSRTLVVLDWRFAGGAGNKKCWM